MLNDMVNQTKSPAHPARYRPILSPGIVGRAVAAISIQSSLMLSALLLIMVLRPLAMTHKVEISPDNVFVRPFGNPDDALTRIQQENFTTVENLDELANNPDLNSLERLVYQYAPLILTTSDDFPRSDDTFIGVYYLASETVGEESTVSTIRYFFFSTDENGGTLIRKRLALFGQPIDRELIYRLTIIDGNVTAAYFQAPGHHLTPYEFPEGSRPIFTIASANHNFRPVPATELERRLDYRILTPFPHHELRSDPAHDPDFVALAAQEAMAQHGVNLSEYLYVEFQNPVHNGLTTISVRINGRWYYLHNSIAGITRPGYNQAGIYLGFAPDPETIGEMWLVAFTDRPIDLEVISIYIYPSIDVAA
ncbi:MAG: hypothetical protein R3A46_17090 [Thermomicrobiales bacterium]